MLILKLVGGLLLVGLLLLAGGLADVVFNDATLIYALMGRDRLLATCLPELARTLAERGFAPSDVQFGGKPSLGFLSGRGGTLRDTFTFSDGPEGGRVDGTMACAVVGSSVRVEVRTMSLPRRAA